MKNNKYQYWKVIQQHYGQGWEDVSHYECNSQGIVTEMSGKCIELKYGRKRELTLLGHDLKEYQTLGYPTRVIFRKEKNELISEKPLINKTKSVCVHCETDKDIRVIDGSYWCKKCRTNW